MRWHIITGEYPPQPGGVSDYTRSVACGLVAAGDQVEVWAPECGQRDESEPGVRVHRLPGHFGPRALAMMDRAIGGAGDHRILVQYVPHAFGLKAMNLPFCYWLYARRSRDITVLFHEVAFQRRTAQPLRHNLLGEVTSLMATLVARSARRIFVSSLAWEAMLRPLVGNWKSIEWLPVPSNVPVHQRLRRPPRGFGRSMPRAGFWWAHFGTYGAGLRNYLETALPELLRDARVSVILLGRGSGRFARVVRRYPHDRQSAPCQRTVSRTRKSRCI